MKWLRSMGFCSFLMGRCVTQRFRYYFMGYFEVSWLISFSGEEKDRFGLWWRECGIDGFDLSNSVWWWLSCSWVIIRLWKYKFHILSCLLNHLLRHRFGIKAVDFENLLLFMLLFLFFLFVCRVIPTALMPLEVCMASSFFFFKLCMIVSTWAFIEFTNHRFCLAFYRLVMKFWLFSSRHVHINALTKKSWINN